MRVLITGISTRAIAESAVRSGYQVVALDAFGDLDLQALSECYSLRRDFHAPFSAVALFVASRRLAFDAVAYTSNLENHPAVVRRFARRHRVLGNPAEVLTRVRHWPALFAVLAQAGFRVPETICEGEESPDVNVRAERAKPYGLGSSPRRGLSSLSPTILSSGRLWLRKPVRSGGGHGIAFWHDGVSPLIPPLAGRAAGRGFMLQEYVPGAACSASFVANGRECVVVGLTEQLIGQPEFGARGFRYCGNLLPLDAAHDPVAGRAVLDQVQRIAALVTREFGLVGVNGFDFVLYKSPHPQPLSQGEREEEVCLIEVNPRYSASMELIERAYGLPVFDLHVRAVLHGELPEFDLAARLADGPFHGKAILYAERDAVAPDTRSWLERGIRDVPFPGESLVQGGPICTVLACEPTRDACFARLVAQAEALKGEIYA
jgi:predicted ATP-grasp superfamily ATP-dependent carboligase